MTSCSKAYWKARTENILCRSWSKWDLAWAICGFGCGVFFLFCCWGFGGLFVCFVLVVVFGWLVFICFLNHGMSWAIYVWMLWLHKLFDFLAVLYSIEGLLSLWNFITLKPQNISSCLILFLGVHPAMLDNWVKSVRPEIAGHYRRKTLL